MSPGRRAEYLRTATLVEGSNPDFAAYLREKAGEAEVEPTPEPVGIERALPRERDDGED